MTERIEHAILFFIMSRSHRQQLYMKVGRRIENRQCYVKLSNQTLMAAIENHIKVVRPRKVDSILEGKSVQGPSLEEYAYGVGRKIKRCR